jgi:hypothetical protein
MADEPHVIRGINWREAFPFTHLFRGFRIAIHPSKLVLGLVLLLELYFGGRILDRLWNEDDRAVPREVFLYEEFRAQGGALSDFADLRSQTRQQVKQAYADRLLASALVKTRQEAVGAADDGGFMGELRDQLLRRRGEQVKAAEDAYTAARDRAASAQGEARDQGLRQAERTRDVAVAAAFNNASAEWEQVQAVEGQGIFISFFGYQTTQINGVVRGILGGNWLGGLWGHEDGGNGVLASIVNFFVTGPLWLMHNHWLYFILFTLLFLVVWSLFGGAIARIAAVHVARDEKLSVRAALHFSIGKFLSFVSAPLIPLVIVLGVGLVPLTAGLLVSLPYFGPIAGVLTGILFLLVLIAGFIMTLVLLGTFGGLNLMYPTIAAEGSDSFDAISRSFSYVYARPWRMIFHTLVALVYGALTYLFIRIFAAVCLGVTHQFLNLGLFRHSAGGADLMQALWPISPARLSYNVDFLSLSVWQDVTAGLIAFWVYLVVGLVGAYVISYYFSASTIIYFLMRREVDATEMDDVYLEESEEDFGETAPAAAAPPESAAAGSAPTQEAASPAAEAPPEDQADASQPPA